MSPDHHHVAIAQPQHYIINPTNLCRALDDGIEHRLHIGRRTADNAKHFGCRRLMLQRFAQLALRS